MSKDYYAPHITEARQRLVEMLEAIDTGSALLSVQSGTELKAAVSEPKTLSVFVRIEITDARKV